MPHLTDSYWITFFALLGFAATIGLAASFLKRGTNIRGILTVLSMLILAAFALFAIAGIGHVQSHPEGQIVSTNEVGREILSIYLVSVEKLFSSNIVFLVETSEADGSEVRETYALDTPIIRFGDGTETPRVVRISTEYIYTCEEWPEKNTWFIRTFVFCEVYRHNYTSLFPQIHLPESWEIVFQEK